MTAQATGLDKALRLATLILAGIASTSVHAQSMVGTVPVKSAAPTGVPTIAGNPTRMLVAGTFYDFRPSAADPNGDPLTFSINRLPRWATFDAKTGRLHGTPVVSDVGRIKGIKISVSDGTSSKSLGKFSIKVVKGQPPTISGVPTTAVSEGQAYAFQPSAADGDLQTLRYAIINKPTWATFDAATGRLSGTPPKGSAGTYANVGVSVTDGASTASLAPFTITVAAATNAAPQILGTPPGSVQVGQIYDFVPAAADADGDTLRFAIVNTPSWANFDANSGRLTGKPPAGSEGSYADIVISVSDGKVFGFLPPFTITVAAASPNKTGTSNSPPTISGSAPLGAVEGVAYAFQPGASDADGDTLTYSASNLPAWLAVDAGTGRLGGTPPAGSAGTYSGIVVTVSDGKASASLPAFSITVTKVAQANTPPTITGSPATGVTAGQEYSFRATVSDADGDALSYTISNKPAWLSFNFTTGQLQGRPSDLQVGTYGNIRITVSDGKSSATLPTFSITVVASSSVNSPPRISGSPAASVKEGIAYSFTPSASDPDGQALRFGIANMPSWAVFDNVTGRMSGTPAVGSAGVYSNIVVSVSDGQVSATLPAFSVTVIPGTQPNQAPTISGTPATSVSVGQAYSFQPGASDPDGQVLAFGIANRPAWATFDIATGMLTGTPAAADVATYANVVISVSDGTASATLPAFSIVVKTPVIGSAELIWTAPTLNEDGTPLTNLAGYKIRYGSSYAALNQVVDVPNPARTSATIEGLAAGIWYFAISSYTNTGVESASTGAVSKTIN